ncbi:LLM class flavin-dependent oxidoreductase [Acidothermaceae bacterium B102]|nr:LLM class flavin-dependent oxidoreductase [Acidothermaceae bacterium B102]
MQLGIDSFVSQVTDPETGIAVSPADRLRDLLTEVEHADQAGVDSFGIGEHHRAEFLDSAPVVLLAAAAARTQRIRLHSAVTVLSADDPVRVFQSYATLDLLSRGRAEMVVGRGSSVEAFPLFGYDLDDYDALFAEKLDLLLQIRADSHVHWQGQFRAPLQGQGIFPRPFQDPLPIWLGVGGTPASFVRAGVLGLPLMVAIIGGEPQRFRPLVDLYRQAGEQAGHDPELLKVGIHVFGYLADTDGQASDDFYPGWAQMMTTLGRERGFPPPVRRSFEAMRGPDGAFFIGEPEAVARKVLRVSEQLGGLARVTLQMTNIRLQHERLLHSIELLGGAVAPLVRDALA